MKNFVPSRCTDLWIFLEGIERMKDTGWWNTLILFVTKLPTPGGWLLKEGRVKKRLRNRFFLKSEEGDGTKMVVKQHVGYGKKKKKKNTRQN